MIFVTGDTHGTLNIGKLDTKRFSKQKKLTKDDYVIICGDFGAIWNGNETDNKELNIHSSKNYTTLFVDGNHENFEALNAYPVEYWNGGKIHRIREDIIHLMRGQVYVIDGVKLFAMGGATSIDKQFRIPHRTWWHQENPSHAEIEEAYNNLDRNNWSVDYVLTHTTSNIVMKECLCFQKEDEALNKFFDVLHDKLNYKWWFFGHFHEDIVYPEYKCTCLLDYVRTLDNNIVK